MGEFLDLLMFATAVVMLLRGYPVAFTLAGVALIFAALGVFFQVGYFSSGFGFIKGFYNRIFGIMDETNEVLVAIPLFVFMGVMLERSKVAGELLETMGRLFGSMPGGLGLAVSFVGMLLAASTGIVGATVVTMGLISLPSMLKYNYNKPLACGSIAAAGTLGQIIPPSIVLVILGDQISNAYIDARRSIGDWSPEPVSVGDLFAGALIPGLVLVALYMVYQIAIAIFRPQMSPAMTNVTYPTLGEVMRVLFPPVFLIIAVLGSILIGIATPTEAAAVGAIGAILIAGARSGQANPLPALAAIFAMFAAFAIHQVFDTRLQIKAATATGCEVGYNIFGSCYQAVSDATYDQIGVALAILCTLAIIWGVVDSLRRNWKSGVLAEVVYSSTKTSVMVFMILIGAQLFNLVFRGLGGEDLVHHMLSNVPGGAYGALVAVMLVMFFLGFFIDFIEIVFIIVPIMAPVLFKLDVYPISDPVWVSIMIAVNLQTSFLTPPFGFALFYLRGVAPPSVSTMDIYKGIIPFVIIQILMLFILFLFPAMATWLPKQVFS